MVDCHMLILLYYYTVLFVVLSCGVVLLAVTFLCLSVSLCLSLSVTGPQVETYADRGLCLRTVDYLFQCTRRLAASRAYIIKLSVIEIYNDLVVDLLREGGGRPGAGPGPGGGMGRQEKPPKLILMDTPEGVVIPALYLCPVEAEEEAYSKVCGGVWCGVWAVSVHYSGVEWSGVVLCCVVLCVL